MGKFWDSVKGVIGGGLTSGLTGAITSLFGGDDKQLEMQKELNEQAAELNYEYGEKAAENAYRRQLAMYERSYQDQSYRAMRKQMEDAGLSVGLMYGGSGSGGGQGEMSGAPQGATGGAQAGRAPTAIERQMANMQLSQLALTMENLKADVNVKKTVQEKNLAEAEAARANAGLTTEEKITETQRRDALIEELIQRGMTQWIENIVKMRAAINDPNEVIEGSKRDQYGQPASYDIYENSVYGKFKYNYGSMLDKEQAYTVLKTAADTAASNERANLNEALANLNNEKKKYYWAEVLSALTRADAAATTAAANKLSAEWNTGEKYNDPNYWIEIGVGIIGDIGGDTVRGLTNKSGCPILDFESFKNINKSPCFNSSFPTFIPSFACAPDVLLIEYPK